MKQKFRTSKDFKALEKVTKSLERYFGMNLPSDLQTLMDLIPENYIDELYLPTKNVIDYIMVRLQGVVKLFEYVMKTSVDIAYMLNIRIQTGHFWRIGFILFSIISRIYVLSKHIIKATCNFYLKLLSISPALKYVGKIWLPENYIFPDNLESSLDIDILQIDKDFQKMQEPTAVIEILDYFKLVEDSDTELEFTEVLNEGVHNRPNIINKNDKNILNKRIQEFNSGEDIGEVIEISDNNNDVKGVVSEHRNLKTNFYSNKKIVKNKDAIELISPINDNEEVNFNPKKIRGIRNNANFREDIKQIIEISDDSNDMGSGNTSMIKQRNYETTLTSLNIKKKRKKLELRKKIKKNQDSIHKSKEINSCMKGRENQKNIKMQKLNYGGDIEEILFTDNNDNKIHFKSDNRSVGGKQNNRKKRRLESKKRNKKELTDMNIMKHQEQKCVSNITGYKLEKHQKIHKKRKKLNK